MAIFHLQITPVSRGGGGSATASAAYQAGERIRDERTGQSYNYSRRRDVEHTQIVVPAIAVRADLAWLRDRGCLWNAAERAETRRNARVAREYIVALPHELSAAQRLELARAFTLQIANRYGVVADLAVHRATHAGDARNVHAHVLTSTRELTGDGFGAKSAIEYTPESFRAQRQHYVDVRASWAALANDYLARYGHEARIDHRSLAEQGINRRPTTHLGPAVVGMSRRGIVTEVQKRIALEAQEELRQRGDRGLGEPAGLLPGSSPSRALNPVVAQRASERPVRSAETVRQEATSQWTDYRADVQRALTRERHGDAARSPERSAEHAQTTAAERWQQYKREHAPELGASVEPRLSQRLGTSLEPERGRDAGGRATPRLDLER